MGAANTGSHFCLAGITCASIERTQIWTNSATVVCESMNLYKLDKAERCRMRKHESPGFSLLLRKINMAYSETTTERTTAMFKNRAVQVKMVNTKKQDAAEKTEPTFDFEKIAKIVKENAKPVIVTIAAVVAANKVLDTACDIAVIAAEAKFNS